MPHRHSQSFLSLEMGKYIREGKIKREVSRSKMEVCPPFGVRTRAKTKTLALQRLQNARYMRKISPLSSSNSSSSSKSPSCYLQLRSRRLEKCFVTNTQKGKPSPKPIFSPSPNSSIEGSFGENVVEVEGKSCNRNSRETTPCSLIRKASETIGTPGSSTRPTSTAATNRGIQGSTWKNIPNSREMEEFFAVPEQKQQKAFAEKYNFDPAEDCPLPGRYEWVNLQN